MNNISNLTVKQLQQAISIKERIEDLEQQLASIMGGSPAPARPGRPPGRRPGRPRATPAAAAPAPVAESGEDSGVRRRGRKRRKMSEEGRRRISEAAKRRWAREKANKG